MLSVRLDEAALRPLLPPGVEIAAFNAPDLLVVSGPAGPLAAARAAIEAAGGLCRPLRTSHAFHSAMMAPAEAAFRAALRGVRFHEPAIPLVGNLTGTWLGAEQARDPETWVRQLRAPVRFAEGVATLLAAGHRQALELGPGSALSTLFARQGGRSAALQAPPQGGDDLQAALQALGHAWGGGATLDWGSLWPTGRPTPVPLPPYSFERTRHWVEAPGAVAPPRPAETPSVDGGGLEAQVIALWRRHLGYTAIGPDDDFHRLGGDSLLAVRLAADLNRACGGDLQPHELLSHPTPRRLARRLAAGRAEGLSPSQVVLREGRPGVPPLLLFHAVGGTVNLYADLVAAMDPDLPVIAFQSPLVAGGPAGPPTVAGMVRDYLAALRPRQDRGPWRLAGSSFGGMLAFEAARQLIAAGETVELLALLDTPGPGDLPRELADDAEVLSYIARILGRPLEAASLRALAPEAMLDRFVAALAERLPPGLTGAAFAVYLAAFKLNTAAMRAYDPPPVAGLPRIAFFKARERDGDTPARPEEAWRRLLGPDALEVIEIAGGHLSMMRAGCIDAVAAWLGDRLKRHAAAG
jgi:thioesterase domain-containing protein